MENQIKLIRAEINLLEANRIGDDLVAVSYEFPYRAKYGERRWSKQVLVMKNTVLDTEVMYSALYGQVQDMRKELEK